VTASASAATLAAYERWAPLYPPIAHNPLMRAEQRAMLEHWPAVAGRRALDLACGSGRYAQLLAGGGASNVVAVDFSAAMLAQVSGAARVRASMMQLPFKAGAFDVVICGLALGHAAGIGQWMTEIERALDDEGTLLYSDFHPEAARAGITRSFKDRDNISCTIPHRCYPVDLQRDAVTAAGLTVDAVTEVRVGIELQEPFAGSASFYRQWHGLPIVLVVRAHK
jgi:malonyl-CoA O-methyltransferase